MKLIPGPERRPGIDAAREPGSDGRMQLDDAVENGYWHAKQPEFFSQPWSRIIEWLRMPGDLIFLFVGILPVVYLALRMFAARRRYARLPAETTTEEFTQWYEEA